MSYLHCHCTTTHQKFSIGQYTLFQIADKGKQCPAKFVSRDGPYTGLTWHAHNVYDLACEPASPTFTCLAQKCIDALSDATFNAASKSVVSY